MSTSVDTFREAASELRRPFTPEAIRWKVQTQFPDGKTEDPRFGQVVAYIDARLVVERLNLIVPHLWADEYELLTTTLLKCRLTVDGITRQDVGEGNGKGLYSDALKRAAVKFGVGVSLYAIPTVRMEAGQGVARLPVKGPKGKRSLRIEPGQAEWLRGIYAKWLEDHGIQQFGDPLDHGDSADSQGDPEEVEAAEEAPEGVDETTGELIESKPPAKKITKARVKELATLFEESPFITREALTAKLHDLGVSSEVTDPTVAVPSLKTDQADALEAWLKAEKPPEPVAPELS